MGRLMDMYDEYVLRRVEKLDERREASRLAIYGGFAPLATSAAVAHAGGLVPILGALAGVIVVAAGVLGNEYYTRKIENLKPDYQEALNNRLPEGMQIIL